MSMYLKLIVSCRLIINFNFYRISPMSFIRKAKKPTLKFIDHTSPILHKRTDGLYSRPPSKEEITFLKNVAFSMVYNQTIYHKKLLGISSPQVGCSRRFILMACTQNPSNLHKVTYCLNPSIISILDPTESSGEEGCLSLLETLSTVSRPSRIKVEYFDLLGNRIEKELADLPARIFLHEHDHLEGVLMTEKAISSRPNPAFERASHSNINTFLNKKL